MKIFYILQLIYLLNIQWIINANLNDATKSKNIQEINCGQNKTDSEITDSFPFSVQLNPALTKSSITYGLMTNGRINYIQIVDEKFCIPSNIFCLKYLETLIINNSYFCDSNGRNYLPEQIIKLKKLQTLKISHVNLISLPNIIGNLSSLKDLTISHVNLRFLPKTIGNLFNLKDLSISHANLAFLPETIGNLSHLRYLSICNTPLRSLPKTISNIKSLERITLKYNPQLQSIRNIHDLPALYTLDIRHCSIQDLPRNLPKLNDLYMSSNKLTKLNFDIGTLSNKKNKSQNFEFDNNYIELIAPEIRHLHTLSRLHLAQNQLHTLPDDIFNMTRLTYLNLSNNNFSTYDNQHLNKRFSETNPELKVIF
ncbi:unnamed protein product [Adineta steineri]|uniref:Disease resistance R13L4/SHOC-2-like LRR domain-containing protein n=1 Tax=Adineta steineri TaxID=433720 RepID=A0A815IXF0_9BILA|nr:unnamed protein product [Adineta steineri]CAF3537675.1 unnamed protein product [Adineta steineri]